MIEKCTIFDKDGVEIRRFKSREEMILYAVEGGYAKPRYAAENRYDWTPGITFVVEDDFGVLCSNDPEKLKLRSQ